MYLPLPNMIFSMTNIGDSNESDKHTDTNSVMKRSPQYL